MQLAPQHHSNPVARPVTNIALVPVERAAALLSDFLAALDGELQPHSDLMLYAKARAERQLKEWGIAR
ncbi:hypothetical protein [Novosphingobium sp. 9]|uniref:hypothetical protein n=1 Tax=Novosphingobium sp. 9 TaxID=2025349 RepID=UPI0021B67EE7|nr:hypothetical protein [Novosphingobium sp. 9]